MQLIIQLKVHQSRKGADIECQIGMLIKTQRRAKIEVTFQFCEGTVTGSSEAKRQKRDATAYYFRLYRAHKRHLDVN